MKDIETSTTHRLEDIRAPFDAPVCPESTHADPAITAFVEYAARRGAEMTWCRTVRGDDVPDAMAAAEWGAMLRLADAVPTTMEGLVAKITAAFALLGDPKRHERVLDPESYEKFGPYNDDVGGRCLRSLLAGAKALAEKERAV